MLRHRLAASPLPHLKKLASSDKTLSPEQPIGREHCERQAEGESVSIKGSGGSRRVSAGGGTCAECLSESQADDCQEGALLEG